MSPATTKAYAIVCLMRASRPLRAAAHSPARKSASALLVFERLRLPREKIRQPLAGLRRLFGRPVAKAAARRHAEPALLDQFDQIRMGPRRAVEIGDQSLV